VAPSDVSPTLVVSAETIYAPKLFSFDAFADYTAHVAVTAYAAHASIAAYVSGATIRE
jgi:hypothetical protein